MIISESEGFVFVHNPKCAGTSVRGALLKYETTGNFFWMFDVWNGYTIDKAHMPLYIFKENYPYYFSMLRELFSFVFVRNPYERYISAFSDSHGELYKSATTSGDYSQYKETLRAFTEEMQFDLINLLNRREHRFIAQRDLVYLKDKAVIDLVLKVEDWPRCLKKIGVFHPKISSEIEKTQTLNQKPTKLDLNELLTPAIITKLNQVYEDDFILFDYPMIHP